jgi:hypothetical protein
MLFASDCCRIIKIKHGRVWPGADSRLVGRLCLPWVGTSAYRFQLDDGFQHYPVSAETAGSNRLQPFDAVARTGLGVCSSPKLGLLPRGKGQSSG